MEQNLAITYTGVESATGADDEIFVRLTQLPLAQVVQDANFLDVYQMLQMAAAGLSARQYVDPDCPVEILAGGLVEVALDFYAWPSDLALVYALEAGIGEISGPERVALPVDRDVVFDLSDEVDLGYLLEPGLTFVWVSPCMDEYSRDVPRPTVTAEGTKLIASAPVFGIGRLTGLAAGYRHTVTMTVQKFEETENATGEVNRTGYKIENLRNHITASWQGEDGIETDVLDLETPPCVADYLAECPDGSRTGGSVDDDEEEGTPGAKVYYSTCNGAILLVRY